MLFRLVYMSRRAPITNDRAVTRIGERAAAYNRQAMITGLLVVGETWFLQHIEGIREAVEAVYARIERDARHRDMRLLVSEPIAERYFPNWDMRMASGADMDGLLPADTEDPHGLAAEILLGALDRLRELIDLEGRGLD